MFPSALKYLLDIIPPGVLPSLLALEGLGAANARALKSIKKSQLSCQTKLVLGLFDEFYRTTPSNI
jgi:hypothetical protein